MTRSLDTPNYGISGEPPTPSDEAVRRMEEEFEGPRRPTRTEEESGESCRVVLMCFIFVLCYKETLTYAVKSTSHLVHVTHP